MQFEFNDNNYFPLPKCPQNHLLNWQKTYISNCNKCNSSGLSRFKCIICIASFCTDCIVIPAFPYQCPLGHLMIFSELKNNSCDVCKSDIKGHGYRDSTCDYDICTQCWFKATKED